VFVFIVLVCTSLDLVARIKVIDLLIDYTSLWRQVLLVCTDNQTGTTESARENRK